MKTMILTIALIGLLTGGCTAFANVTVPEETDNEPSSGQKGNKDKNENDMIHPFNFETKTVKLNSGYEMPIIGIGTYYLSTAQSEESVYNALNVGMRLIDTADIYGNEVGVAHGKSTYQVLLRWHLQSGVIAIPGSTNAKHIAEDYDIFDFALTDEEMAKIDALERNQRFASY